MGTVAPFLIWLLADGLGKAAEDGPSTWTLAIRVGDTEEAPGSWISPGSAFSVTTAWRVNWWLEDICLYLCRSLLLSVTLTFK